MEREFLASYDTLPSLAEVDQFLTTRIKKTLLYFTTTFNSQIEQSMAIDGNQEENSVLNQLILIYYDKKRVVFFCYIFHTPSYT